MSDSIGPIDYLVLQVPSERRDGSIAAALADLIAAGTVTILDLMVVEKTPDGIVTIVDLNAVDGEFTVFAGARSGLLGDDERDDAGSVLEPGTSALVLVYENSWARPFVAAARSLDAEVVASARIPADVVLGALDALDG